MSQIELKSSRQGDEDSVVTRIERTLARGHKLMEAAGFHPARTVQAVLAEFTARHPPEEWNGEKLDEFLLEYIALGIRAIRLEFQAKATERAAELPREPASWLRNDQSRYRR